MKHYYEAYEDRYKTIHALGHAWSSDRPTPIVGEILARYGVPKTAALLELGCGEGRDALPLLRAGWKLLATDLSPEAVAWCQNQALDYTDRFRVLDCLDSELPENAPTPNGELPERFDFIYAVAVLHMLTEDEDRARFFAFLRDHLTEQGLALVCTMGDGENELRSDPAKAFDPAERDHPAGLVTVAATSCRIVSFDTLIREIEQASLTILETGLTPSPPDFDRLMFAVVKKAGS